VEGANTVGCDSEDPCASAEGHGENPWVEWLDGGNDTFDCLKSGPVAGSVDLMGEVAVLGAINGEGEFGEVSGGCLTGSPVISKGCLYADKFKAGDVVLELVYSLHLRLYLFFFPSFSNGKICTIWSKLSFLGIEI
jgi:hypothetical protein